jgi:hypothetical protein
MRICFTGSRHWTDYEAVRARLAELKEEFGDSLEVAHGKSPGKGADWHVELAALSLGITQTPFPIRGGPTGVDGPNPYVAPLNRNRRMLLTFMPHVLIAFRSPGKSNGTDYTIKQAEMMDIEVETIHEERT